MRCHASSRACVLYRARTCEEVTKEYSRGIRILSSGRNTRAKSGGWRKRWNGASWRMAGRTISRILFLCFILSSPYFSFSFIFYFVLYGNTRFTKYLSIRDSNFSLRLILWWRHLCLERDGDRDRERIMINDLW